MIILCEESVRFEDPCILIGLSSIENLRLIRRLHVMLLHSINIHAKWLFLELSEVHPS